jgi:Flp pilus assembly pilin Flp
MFIFIRSTGQRSIKQKGQAVVEYGLLLGLITLALVYILSSLGIELKAFIISLSELVAGSMD